MNKYYNGEPKLLVSVDCIVLGFENKKLQLLVGKRKVEPTAENYLSTADSLEKTRAWKRLPTEFFSNAQVSMTSICVR